MLDAFVVGVLRYVAHDGLLIADQGLSNPERPWLDRKSHDALDSL